jgi:hypothetical protein
MKKSILLLIAIFCLSISCKKEGTKVTQFSPVTNEGVINYDSISYAIINYSDLNEIKGDTSILMNPDIYSHSVKVEKPLRLTLKAEHSYVLKKFDLFDKSGNLLYYIPYRTKLNFNEGFTLPFTFKSIDGSYVLGVIKNI